MRSLVVAALLVLPAAAPAQMRSPLDPKPGCAPASDKANADRTIGPRRLGDLPPASEYKAVWRTENGCPKPLVVRRNSGPAR
jgi:hypothetical protein